MAGVDLLAAGGVLWRPAAGGPRGGADIEVALVHRPRYDDWSLPKGKPEPGEHLLETAVREVAEETGQRAVLGRPLGTSSYRVGAGDKRVRWWAAAATGGDFQAGREVDALRWLRPEAALRTLTHPHDHAPLQALLDPQPATTTMLLVRHGRAGDRASWAGDDRLRPLDATGTAQAERLADVLALFRPERVLAADRTRCIETVEPLARALGVPVELEPALGDEETQDDPQRAVDRLRALATSTGSVAVCSQGGAIPLLLQQLGGQDGVDVHRGGKVAARKASTWVLAFDHGRLVAADYVQSLAPALDA